VEVEEEVDETLAAAAIVEDTEGDPAYPGLAKGFTFDNTLGSCASLSSKGVLRNHQ
jgi:hypothetical protein